jgi:hypothetical protein
VVRVEELIGKFGNQDTVNMNRRQLILAGLSSVLLPSLVRASDVIRIEWETRTEILYDLISDAYINLRPVGTARYHYAKLYIHGELVYTAPVFHEDVNLDAWDQALSTIEESMKRVAYQHLRTHEFDPVIINSVESFYLE